MAKAAAKRTAGDFESRSRAGDHLDLRLWLRTMALHKLIVNELRRRLRVTFGMSLARFDLLSQLVAAPQGLRMGAVSERLMVTTGNITGLVDELERDGLVRRKPDPTSRRALLVAMTAKGRRHFASAAKAHEVWVAEFFANLSQKEKTQLYDLLGRQKTFIATALQGQAPRKAAA